MYELQFFLECDIGELVGKMLILDRFEINQHKFSNSIGTFSYHYNLIIFPSMVCEMFIESSSCPLKKLKRKIKEIIKITSTKVAQFSNNQFLVTRIFKY